MATILNLPLDTYGHIFNFVDKPYMGLFGSTCSTAQSVITCFKCYAKPGINAYEIFVRDGYFHLITYIQNIYGPSKMLPLYAIRYGQIQYFDTLDPARKLSPTALYAEAIEYNQLNALIWLKGKGYGYRVDLICGNAARNGRIVVVDWVLNHNSTLKCVTVNRKMIIITTDIKGGPLEFRLANLMYKQASHCGQLKTLTWLKQSGYNWNHDVCYYAANYGHLHVLKWFIENGSVLNDDICVVAAINGHLHILVWIDQISNIPVQKIYRRAVEIDHIHIIHWLYLTGHEVPENAPLDYI